MVKKILLRLETAYGFVKIYYLFLSFRPQRLSTLCKKPLQNNILCSILWNQFQIFCFPLWLFDSSVTHQSRR